MKKKLAQYFTPPSIADFMIQLADAEMGSAVLEPSCGEGIFLERLAARGFQNVTAYELDESLAQNHQNVRYESFVSAEISERFDLIIGNPPYIRWKHLEEYLKEELLQQPLWQAHCNRLCDYLHIFILRSIELLKEGGQLIFICPEYWMNTTHSQGLRDYMLTHGYFERIYQFKETPIFGGASVACIVFKYIKYSSDEVISPTDTFSLDRRTGVARPIEIARLPAIKIWQYQAKTVPTAEDLQSLQAEANFSCPPFSLGTTWPIIPEQTRVQLHAFEQVCTSEGQQTYSRLGDFCEIANGMVSGLDKAFQWQGALKNLTKSEKAHLLKVVKAKHLQPFQYQQITPYLYLNTVETEQELICDFPNFYRHLQAYRPRLLARYQYGREIPYWHWAFPRSWRLFSEAKPRILVPCKERVSNKDHFRFAFAEAGIYPTQDVTALMPKAETRESIYYILAFLNLPQVFHWLGHKGIVKGKIVEFSERPLSSIPFQTIDWTKPSEVRIHDAIVERSKQLIAGEGRLQDLQQIFGDLFRSKNQEN